MIVVHKPGQKRLYIYIYFFSSLETLLSLHQGMQRWPFVALHPRSAERCLLGLHTNPLAGCRALSGGSGMLLDGAQNMTLDIQDVGEG